MYGSFGSYLDIINVLSFLGGFTSILIKCKTFSPLKTTGLWVKEACGHKKLKLNKL